jgi:signal transduction histidine kinase/CheY-like chemotaxis protein
MPRKWPAVALRAAGFLVVYLATAYVLHSRVVISQAVLWLPTGVAVSGLVLLGWRYWPVVALGTLIHRLLLGYDFPYYLFAALGNSLEALAAVAMLHRFGFRRDLARLRDGLALLATAALAPMVSATLARTAQLIQTGDFSLLGAWANWWRMNALGLLVVVPLVLSWTSTPPTRPRVRTLIEVAGLIAIVIGFAWLVVRLQVARSEAGMVLIYLALPVALYAAARFGVRGAATAAAGMVVLLTVGTIHGIGPFLLPPQVMRPAVVNELPLQAVIAIISATPLLLGAVIAEREAALARVAVERERHQRLEERFRETLKMEALGRLAGGVSHDFNNLLTVIGGHAEILRATLPQGDPARLDAEEIVTASARAARLTRQLLAYSRRQVLEPQVLDLREVIEQLTGMLRRLIGEDVQLVTKFAAESQLVRVDPGQMEQVLLNLAINARDAMPDGGTLTLETACLGPDEALAPGFLHEERPAGPLVCLGVSDTGVGMDPETVRQAFDPFFTTKEPGKGTGLGLSTVYGIVRQSGGLVWIESAPGAGTTVRLCLPRVAEPFAQAVVTPPIRSAPRQSGTVLVVEDEPAVRDLIARTLRGAGYTVIEAQDGQQGLEVARRAAGPLDLVVTDVVMPRMGGRELVERLKAEQPGLPALLVSGYESSAPDPADPREVAIAYLPKPFTPSSLLDHVRDCIAGPRGSG